MLEVGIDEFLNLTGSSAETYPMRWFLNLTRNSYDHLSDDELTMAIRTHDRREIDLLTMLPKIL